MITDISKKVRKITVDGEVMELKQAGGVTGTGQYLVQVVDYDGTVLKSDHLNTGDTFTLPEAPTHDKLVFQGWSSPYDIVDNKVTVDNQDITIGPMYTTASGLSEFDITLTKVTGLTVTFNMVGNKDWGDGTSDSETTHTYTNYGNYTITCDGTTLPQYKYIMGQSSSAYNYTLTNVRLGGSVTRIVDYVFQYCNSLTSITIPSGVTSIDEAFSNCHSLTNITIPGSVTSIGNSAFSSCLSLTSITIPSSVTSIGNSAFSSCLSLTSITIPSSVTSIRSYAFSNCYSLISITIPEGMTIIESSAFYNCYSITSITIPSSVTSIGSYAFSNCYSLTSITIPGSVTSIGESAFSGCYSLTNITIPGGVTSIGRSAFSKCSGLTNITIPGGVTSIEAQTFQGCHSLTSITIPGSVTSIGESAFSGCYSLTSVTIPASVTSIGNNAFTGCYPITKYDFSTATAVPTLSSTTAFNNINGICKIIVPDALYDEWIAATNWVEYQSYIYKVSEVTV